MLLAAVVPDMLRADHLLVNRVFFWGGNNDLVIHKEMEKKRNR